ncbi:MAG: OsmC family protein [Clostridiaceae bacterium]
MALTTFKATTRKKEGLACIGEARDFKLNIDEPVAIGGSDTGMNPVEMLLCSLGGCQTICASAFAGKMGIKLEDFWVELEGDIDLDGFKGKPGVRPGYQNIRFNMHIKSDASEEKVKEFVEFIERTCPIGDSLMKGVKLEEAKITIEK